MGIPSTLAGVCPVLQAARLYLSYGLAVIPVKADGSKSPPWKWQEFQERPPTRDEVDLWFGDGEYGVAVLGGPVSGGLEILDFDNGESWKEWEKILSDALDIGILRRFPRVRTPAGGYHIYLKRQNPGRNRKLARSPEGKCLVEIRGTGGYVLAPGCPAACHPSGKCYEWEVSLDEAWGQP